MPAGFHIENFGCRAARADGEAIGARLSASGHGVRQPNEADVVVVNTCSVTAEADREARAWIRRVHRQNPQAQIVVTGCYAQRAPEELAGLPGVAAVIGNSHKGLAPEIIDRLAGGAPSASQQVSEPASQRVLESAFVDLRALAAAGAGVAPIWADDRFAHSFLEEAQVVPGSEPGSQTRPNLKIQEGCSNRCTFCVIPQTRGNSRSLAEDKVLDQVRGFVAAGGNELVLSGINLGRWGRDLPAASGTRPSLAGLVRRIFAETRLARLRLSSIEPMDWDSDLISVMREFGGSRLARHAHLPLQSGSDAVLRRMHRRYRPWHYAEKVHGLVEAAGPDLTVGADVMVGFPGETEVEFRETYDFIRQLPFGYLHLFPFSPRPGTPGWELHRQSPVAPAAVHERMEVLRQLASEKSRMHRAAFIGRELACITLHTPEASGVQHCTAALTDNFLRLELEGIFPANQIVMARILALNTGNALLGSASQV
jgi:threonylcarbamoyladenosine tRNA methylthiotransferase MtaB